MAVAAAVAVAVAVATAIPWRLVENIVARPGLNQFAAFAKVSVSCRRERVFSQKVPFCVRGVDI